MLLEYFSIRIQIQESEGGGGEGYVVGGGARICYGSDVGCPDASSFVTRE